MIFTERKNKLKGFENYLFLLACLLNLYPVFSGKFFTSLDGAAHLYNSNLINSLIFHPSGQLNSIFEINMIPVPNWTGHFLLSAFNLFLPAFIAEKILLVIILIGLPYSFRSLLKTVSPGNLWLSYCIIPFSFSLFFFLGFYNFLLGVILFFIFLSYWINREERILFFREKIVLFFLLLLLYFSHLFVFILLIALISLRILVRAWFEYKSHKDRSVFRTTLVSFAGFMKLSLLPLLLVAVYFIYRPPSEDYTFLKMDELIDCIFNLRPLIAINYSYELFYSRVILVMFGLLLFVSIIQSRRKPASRNGIYYLAILLFLLVLYFTLPDYDGSAGFITIRILFFLFLFLVLWMSTKKIHSTILVVVVCVVLYCSVKRNIYYFTAVRDLNNLVKEIEIISDSIPENSVVLPVNFSDNWLTRHFSNYLGIDRPMVILENYESEKGYFPVRINEKNLPRLQLGNLDKENLECLEWPANPGGRIESIDHVFIIGNLEGGDNPCLTRFSGVIGDKYRLVLKTNQCSLYRLIQVL